jgi:hypothetical protein
MRQTNDNLRRRDCLLNCRPVIWITSIVQQWTCGLWYTSPWRWLEQIKHWSLAGQRPLHARRNRLIASKRPRDSLSRSCCSLLIRMDVLRHLDASQLQNRHGPLPRLRLWFRTFFKDTVCFRISTRTSCVSSWSWEFSNPETSSGFYARIFALGLILIVWGWGKRRKCEPTYVEGLLYYTRGLWLT